MFSYTRKELCRKLNRRRIVRIDVGDVVQTVVLIAGFVIITILIVLWVGNAVKAKGAEAAECIDGADMFASGEKASFDEGCERDPLKLTQEEKTFKQLMDFCSNLQENNTCRYNISNGLVRYDFPGNKSSPWETPGTGNFYNKMTQHGYNGPKPTKVPNRDIYWKDGEKDKHVYSRVK